MWYPAKVTEAPATLPVTVDEVKLRLRIDAADDAADVELLVASATDHVEKYCNTPLVSRTVEVKCDSFADMAYLPIAPVSAVESITCIDTAGDEQTVPDTVYELRAEGLSAAIVLKSGHAWPVAQTGSRITVTATAGYDEVPPAVKHAILLYIGDAYAVRENGSAPDWTAFDSLLSNYRRGV